MNMSSSNSSDKFPGHEQSKNKLFPTNLSFIIFISYMTLFINQGILVTASQDHTKTYKYNTVTAVLITELLKLIVSACMYSQQNFKSHRKQPHYFHRNSFRAYLEEIRRNWKAFLYYMPTAFLYCLYNNLAYTNLATFDPTTYFLLLQLRVGVTGIVFQILFKQRLSAYQWFSLFLLMIGCMIKEFKWSDASFDISNSYGLFLILLQVCSSSSAGVYNEYLLKKQTQIPIQFQNSCLYVDSVLANVFFLSIQGKFTSGLEMNALLQIVTTPIYLGVVVNNAAIGIVTSFFLSYLNSILKTFASALELLFTAILCYLIFGIPIHFNTFLSIFIVSFAIWLYSKQPVDNRKSLQDVNIHHKEQDQNKKENGLEILLENV